MKEKGGALLEEKIQYDARKSWRHEGNKLIMVLESGENPVLPYQVNMLQYNKIEGLLSMQFYIEDTRYKYFYDVTSLGNIAAEMEHKKYDAAMIRTILAGLYKTVKQMENFLLDIDCLILLPEYIFSDLDMEEIRFCYYPDKENSFQKSLEYLLEYFLDHISYDKDQSVNMIYGIYQKVRLEKEPLGEILKDFCDLEDKEENAESEQYGFEEEHCRNREEDTMSVVQNESVIEENNKENSAIGTRVISILIDVAGAIGTAALVLYMMKNHGNMNPVSYVIWVAAVAVIIFGSSGISTYVLEKGRKSTGIEEISKEHPETTPAPPKRKIKTDPEPENQDKNIPDLDSTKEMRRHYGFEMRNERNKSPDSWKPQSHSMDKETKDQTESDDIFEEMIFHADEHKTEDSLVVNDKPEKRGFDHLLSDIPKTEKISVKDKIPATVVMKRKDTCEKTGILSSLHTEKSQDLIIDEDVLLVGKVPGIVDICLNQDCISRIHAEIGREQGQYYIMDRGSTNGTYVNGVRVRKNCVKYFKEGDIVRLADVEYQFHVKCPENDTQTVEIGV